MRSTFIDSNRIWDVLVFNTIQFNIMQDSSDLLREIIIVLEY